MKLKLFYKPLPTQAKVFHDDLTEVIIQSQGLGAGKTYNLCMKMLKLSQQNRNIAGGLLAPTYRDFKRDILPTMDDILTDNKIKYKFHKTDHTFNFSWSKKPIYVFSGEKPIAGPNLGFCGINEFSLISFDRINEMLRRVRVKDAKNPQKILVGTPEDIHGWLEDFIESQEKRGDNKFKIHYGSSNENTHIDGGYSQMLESMLDDQALQIFRDGKIGRIGSDYFYYSFDSEKNIDDTIQENTDMPVHVGLDFNVGKMSASFSHRYGDKQLFFDEVLLKGDSNSCSMCQYLMDRFDKNRMIITCDAAGNNRSSATQQGLLSDVQIIRSYGLNVRHFSANPRLRKRQLIINGMFSHGRVRAHSRCKYLINDWKKTRQKDGFTKDEGKDKMLSHFSDGADYVIMKEHDTDIRRQNIIMR
ncbi:MAG: hypothetical protein OEL89_00690 [Candidatus Peregrinibacteria bacterium]|nr:hypothetical protein [Candidatus Peregrinibacteria bacterium]